MTAEAHQPAMSDTEALERFVIDNDDLLALESRIGRFNIFDALGIARMEIRHSNFLAFLLDPAESHGQGQLFLTAILMDLLKDTSPEMRPLSPIDLDGTDLRGIEVKREWKHLDILIRCQEPPFIVVVENKIEAQEGSNQLARYKEAVKKHYPAIKTLHVYLTVDGDDPSDEDWIPYRHADVHRVLSRVRDTYRNSIGDDVLVFLDHYLGLIGTRFMNDDVLDKPCQQIYTKHRQALDLIRARVGTPLSAVLAEAAKVLEEDGRWEEVTGRSSGHFVPKEWLGWLPPLGAGKGDARAGIYVRLWESDGKLGYAVEMTPMNDSGKRIEISTKLLDAISARGFKRPKSRSVKNNYSRVSSFENIMDWEQGETPEAGAVRGAVKKMIGDIYPKLQELAKVLKPMC